MDSSVTIVAEPDPGSGASFTPWIRDPGWVKNQDPDPGCTSQIIGISESLKTIFWVKTLKFLDADADPGWKNSDPG